MKIQAEYIWLDGQAKKKQPGNFDQMAELRSKTQIVEVSDPRSVDVSELPVSYLKESVEDWGFDGSSTEQALGDDSDCGLKPVAAYKDPIRGYPNILVMCEVVMPDGRPHRSNTRWKLARAAKRYQGERSLFGIEQEYTLFDRNMKPLAWSVLGVEPAGQGRYYCGVGADRIFGRQLMERHTKACLDAGLKIGGTNWEVMPGQAEFQIGPLSALEVADQLWVARWLIQRIGEDLGIVVSFHPKPMGKDADWNGAGAHTNYSTAAMMAQETGWDVIQKACKSLKRRHHEHIKVYGACNDQRLSGKHETCSIKKFRYGVSDRGASIRIPMRTAERKCGYIEDRRPAANMDPYLVCRAILETVCGEGFKK
ncbi:MAG: glutamine synthetase beta-grasp domain-containing protein [Patescibacteria group bacterium]